MEELFYNKYLKQEILGRGASSEVWRVIDQQTGVTQAIKIYSPAVAIENDGIEMLKHEFALMANINHQNLLRPLFFGIDGIKPFLVLPFCKNGNLKKWVGKFTEDDAWRLLHDVASGLAYLHKQQPPIIHQDIKPENILIGDDGSYLLTDFGISAHASTTTRATISSTLTSAGTVAYMPPEKFGKEKSLITLSDIWSLGAMTYELLTGEVPFSIGVMEGGALQMNGAEIPYLPESVKPALADTVYKCLSKDPWDRPKAAELELFANQMLRGEEVSPPWVNLDKEDSQQPSQTQTQPQTSQKPKKWLIIAVCGIILSIVTAIFVLAPVSGPDDPVLIDSMSVENQYEQAYEMLKDKAMAREGFEKLQQLSEKKHYERATFLWSRLLFHSIEEDAYENPDYPYMRGNAGIIVNNDKAHRLLERAVEEDNKHTNGESRYQLALDYIDNDKRDPSYASYKQIPYYEKAVTLLNEGLTIANANNPDLAEKCTNARQRAENRIEQLKKENKRKK